MKILRNLCGTLLLAAIVLTSCQKETEKPFQYGFASDIDGNHYKTVKIDEDVWMTSSLKVSRFRNGDTIPEASTKEEWEAAWYLHTPAWCYYEGDSLNGEKYGKLYNWFAVNDYRGLAPEGWIVPSHAQWTALVNFLGGSWEAGAKLKNKTGWNNNGNGTDETRFSALPGGTRFSTGDYIYKGSMVKFWSSTVTMENPGEVYHAMMSSQNGLLNQFSTATDHGLYVRCIQYK